MDNQGFFQYPNSTSDWNDMSELINNTQKLKLDDNNLWNPSPTQGFNNFATEFFGMSKPQPFSYPTNNIPQKQTEYAKFSNILELNKSKSDYVYPTSNQYFQQQFQQNPTHFSPYLGPTSKKPVMHTVLKLQVISKQAFELDFNNIYNAFSQFKSLVDVLIEPNGSAYVIFANLFDAQQAEMYFNKKNLMEDAKLVVSFSNERERLYAIEKSKQKKIMMATNSYSDQSPIASPSLSSNSTSSSTYAPKFTCKYEIQIDNDKEFQVARRIIGSKGYNMKRIIQSCQQKGSNMMNTQQADLLKLRLRGRGSGFKEGPEKKESDEPLHLCISSKDQEVYRMACQLVEELLRSIYREYIAFCQSVGQLPPEKLEIKCIESVPNKENPFIQPRDPQPKFQQQPVTQLTGKQYNVPSYPFEQNVSPMYTGQKTVPNQGSLQNDSKYIEQLIAAYIKARNEFNFIETEKIRNQLKMFGISLFSEEPEKSKLVSSAWEPQNSKY